MVGFFLKQLDIDYNFKIGHISTANYKKLANISLQN